MTTPVVHRTRTPFEEYGQSAQLLQNMVQLEQQRMETEARVKYLEAQTQDIQLRMKLDQYKADVDAYNRQIASMIGQGFGSGRMPSMADFPQPPVFGQKPSPAARPQQPTTGTPAPAAGQQPTTAAAGTAAPATPAGPQVDVSVPIDVPGQAAKPKATSSGRPTSGAVQATMKVHGTAQEVGQQMGGSVQEALQVEEPEPEAEQAPQPENTEELLNPPRAVDPRIKLMDRQLRHIVTSRSNNIHDLELIQQSADLAIAAGIPQEGLVPYLNAKMRAIEAERLNAMDVTEVEQRGASVEFMMRTAHWLQAQGDHRTADYIYLQAEMLLDGHSYDDATDYAQRVSGAVDSRNMISYVRNEMGLPAIAEGLERMAPAEALEAASRFIMEREQAVMAIGAPGTPLPDKATYINEEANRILQNNRGFLVIQERPGSQEAIDLYNDARREAEFRYDALVRNWLSGSQPLTAGKEGAQLNFAMQFEIIAEAVAEMIEGRTLPIPQGMPWNRATTFALVEKEIMKRFAMAETDPRLHPQLSAALRAMPAGSVERLDWVKAINVRAHYLSGNQYQMPHLVFGAGEEWERTPGTEGRESRPTQTPTAQRMQPQRPARRIQSPPVPY